MRTPALRHWIRLIWFFSIASISESTNYGTQLERHFQGGTNHSFGEIPEFPGGKEPLNHTCIHIRLRAPIRALQGGKVLRAGWIPEYHGLTVEIETKPNLIIAYGCLSRIDVKPDAQIIRNQTLGIGTNRTHQCGTNGGVSIYYRKNGEFRDPVEIFSD